MSGTERLTYIHSGACMDNLETNGFLTILEQLTLVTKEKAMTLISTRPEIKKILEGVDSEKLFTELSTAIVRSYVLLHTMANSLADSDTRRKIVIADAGGVISEQILESLRVRVTDLPFQLLNTTRIEHFQAFLAIVKEKGSVRVGKYAQLQYIDGKYILSAVGGNRVSHLAYYSDRPSNSLQGNLLAKEPRKCATVIKLW